MNKGLTVEGWKEERPEANETTTVTYNPNKGIPIDQQRYRLPIYEFKDQLLYLLEQHQVLVIRGETGCGKSTQIGQYLTDAGWSRGVDNLFTIGITQPRRVAATSLAKRVAEERGCHLGKQVGYSIRFDDCYEPGITVIKYMTEGILIREMMSDPLLKNYSVIMVDEIHERTLQTDVLLGLMKKILRKRPEFRLIVSSATVEVETMEDFFTEDGLKTTNLAIEGRTHPVEIFFSNEPVADYLKSSVDCVIKIHETLGIGDILVFLTGQDEVEKACESLLDYARGIKDNPDYRKMFVLPLYSSLPSADQLKVFDVFPRSVRKVIVATNLAEASITINGIVYVIDCGFVKLRYYNPKTCTDSLVVVPISQASAAQRAGRAGRTKPGSVYRLYTENDYKSLEPFTCPEIRRSSLSPVILQLKALGVNNILKFSFPSKPPEYNLITGLELLYALGGLDDNGHLTEPLGLQMVELPLEPMFAKMLLISGSMGCSEEALTIASMLQVQNIFVQPSSGQRSIAARNCKHSFSVEEGDLITYLNVYNSFMAAGKVKSWADSKYLNYKGLLRAVEVRSRLSKLLRRFNEPIVSAEGDVDLVRRCIVAGFFANAAYLHPTGVYKTVKGDHELHLHPTSVLYTRPRPPQWVIFVEVLHTTKEYMRDCTVIDCRWLYELAPHYYEFGTDREVLERKLQSSK
ncbi:probable ATP-dependent RNA helicase DHX35 isoform X2 [Panonychus citri]|uniref:probable ATP-dependent RNA helicase DHX35 isoform X2 n=1 Tax=Panonychus citri TaxID=50023 RepID=UPI002307E8D2|nr:probable ATP-dependent RNA helicase DHX35 isoform X2 [Panonychus citri]XP_053202533.1 probable ATP-dependent RNA helicase DHX35 isoform X2 [Panonychus citri]